MRWKKFCTVAKVDGLAPCAFVVLKEGAAPIAAEGVIVYCRENMVCYKVPRTVEFGTQPKPPR